MSCQARAREGHEGAITTLRCIGRRSKMSKGVKGLGKLGWSLWGAAVTAWLQPP